MKRYIWFLLAALITGCAPQAKISNPATENVPVVVEGHGDLYVLYPGDESTRIIAADAKGNVLDTTFSVIPANLVLRYVAAGKDTDIAFEFKLHKRIKHPWRQQKAQKTLVVSDFHGRLDAFAALLKTQKVVDEELNWIYGSNQLIFNGDILDRGRDDNGIAWLLYKLEQEAELAGGRVDFILGNHEDLVLKDDIRYVNESHLIFASMAGIPYYLLYGPDTELGRWIRDSYMILVVGDDLFVHAGLSPHMVEKSYEIGEMNELASRFVGYPTAVRKNMHSRNDLLFGSNGPIWYRGLTSDQEKYDPISSKDLNRVLRNYKVKRIIVGHTEVDEVVLRYDGRVIPVNVKHYNNFPAGRTGGLLIEGDKYYAIDYKGNKSLLAE